jgi:predicted murein hydrolase (TIGR00659 family)
MSALSPTTAAWMAATISLYAIARVLQARLRGHPLANTVILPAAVIVLVLALAPSHRDEYQAGGRVLLWLLGPATVALAVPLYTNFGEVRLTILPALASLVAGSLTAVLSAVGIAVLLSASTLTIRSLAPKSVTTPIAMAIAESIGGNPSLAAVFVIITGAVGALSGSFIFDRLRVQDQRARGFATGVAAHGMGTARAFQVDATAGIFASVGMTLNGIITAILLPAVWRLLS